MDSINTFEINKSWFSYVAENINVKPIHTAIYFFIFNKWNSLYWKKNFGLPTDNTMECLNIRSYKTYITALNDLESFGFIKFIERSKNQNTSNVIEVVKNTKATTKATTKAMLKATTQSDYQSGVQSDVSIVKHYNIEQINILTNKHKEVKEFLKTIKDDDKFNFRKSLIKLGVEEDNANEFLSHRKKANASSTNRAFNNLISEFEKTEYNTNECIEICLGYKLRTGKVWTGFKAEWIKNINNNMSNGYQANLQEPTITKSQDAAIGLAKRVAERHYRETGERIPYEHFINGGN